jgi:PAS domain S-box-containing protein
VQPHPRGFWRDTSRRPTETFFHTTRWCSARRFYKALPQTLLLFHARDITECNITEREKRRVTRELRFFMDTTNAPTIDAKGLLVNEWNEAFEITSFTRQEVVGRDLVQDFITEEYRESVRAVIDDALRGKETANFEFALYTKDKRRVDVLLNSTTRRDLSGGVIGFFFLGQPSLCKRIRF